jgi:hypothetical protein
MSALIGLRFLPIFSGLFSKAGTVATTLLPSVLKVGSFAISTSSTLIFGALGLLATILFSGNSKGGT